MEAVSQVRRSFQRSRRIAAARYFIESPSRFVRHRRESVVIAGPGTLGFDGGVFNPGVVALDDGSFVLLAKAQHTHWDEANGDRAAEFMRGAPVLLRLDSELAVIDRKVVELNASLLETPIEDFRLFRRGDQIWVNHNMIQFEQAHGFNTQTHSDVGLSVLDIEAAAMRFVGAPTVDFATMPFEKNWLFVDVAGDTLVFYSAAPWRVLRQDPTGSLAYKTMINDPSLSMLHDIGGHKTLTSFSTNPLVYDEQHWIVLLHQVDPGRLGWHFCNWALLVDRDTFRPTYVTKRPVLDGSGVRGRVVGALYPMSLHCTDRDVVAFCGEGDSYVTRVHIARSGIDGDLVAVA